MALNKVHITSNWKTLKAGTTETVNGNGNGKEDDVTNLDACARVQYN